MKSTLNQIKNNRILQNFPLIIMMALYVAVFFTFFPITLPVVTANYEKPKEEVTPLQAWVAKREAEIFQEKLEGYKADAKMWALLEAQEALQDELLGTTK